MTDSTENKVPQVPRYVAFLDNAIRQQRVAVTFYVCHACTVIAVGLVAITIAFALGETYKWFLTIGATFVSALSGFPIKQLLDRRQRITGLAFLRAEFELSQSTSGHLDSERFAFAEQRLRQYLDATLGA